MLRQTIQEHKDELAITGAATAAIPLFYRDLMQSLSQRGNYFFPQQFKLSQDFKSAFKSAKSSYIPEKMKYGLSQHYRGMSQLYLLVGLYPYSTYTIKSLTQKIDPNNDSALTEVAVTGLVGASTAVATTPWETIRMIDMNRATDSLATRCNKIWKQHGLSAFWNGFSTMALRNGLYASCYLTAPGLFKIYFSNTLPGSGIFHELSATALSALIPSAVFTTALTQFDLRYVHKQAAIAVNDFNPVQTKSLEFTSNWKIPGTVSRFKSAYKEAVALTFFSEFLRKKIESNTPDESLRNRGKKP